MSTFTLAAVACQNQTATHPMHKVLDIPGLVDVTMLGDAFYMDSSAGYTIGGTADLAVCYWDFVAAPTGAPVNAYTAQLFYDIFHLTVGRNGPRSHAYYWAESKKRGIETLWQPDDHEYWNNIDHAVSQAAASWTGTPNQIHTISTQAHVLALWDIANAGHDLVLAQYFDNQPRTAFNGDVPNEMRGFADASKYKIKYWAKDYSNILRVLRMDSVSFKSKQTDTDDALKSFWGAAQTAWFFSQCRDAKAKGMQVVVFDTKDYGNNSNSDGPKGYRTVTNAVLTQIQTEDLPVIGFMCGDKHTPHIGLASTANGDAFDSLWVCACPFGQGVSAMSTFPQLMEVSGKPDECVVGVVTVDTVNKEVAMGYVDGYTLETRAMAWVPFNSRIPSRMTSSSQATFYSVPSLIKLNPAAPASGAAYTNSTRKRQTVLIVGGTLTDVTVALDGTNYESVGVLRQIVLGPSQAFKPTYTGTITLSVYNAESMGG